MTGGQAGADGTGEQAFRPGVVESVRQTTGCDQRARGEPVLGIKSVVLRLPVLVWLIAAAACALLLAVASGYGFHRDELYFILAGRHPDFGYVDQPPLTPLLSAVAAALLGVTPLAVRIAPAIAAAAVVVLTADIARRLGASRAGQVLAALVLAISGWLGAGHLDETTTYDVFFWTLALRLLVPLLGPQ